MAKSDATLRRIRDRKKRVTREVVFQRLLQLADRYHVRFSTVMRSAIRIGQRVSLEKLAAVIATKNEAAILAAIPWDDAVQRMEISLPTLERDLATAAARMAERLLPGDLEYRFDITNPLSVRAALDHGAKLVTQIGDETREAIRTVIAQAIQEGVPPLTAAKQIRSSIGLNTRQAGAIAKLIEDGAGAREIARTQERMLRERTTLIARTETLWAANEGQRALWEQGVDAGVISPSAQREYITTPDDRLCPICEPLDGKLYGIDESITTDLGTVDSPPIHPNAVFAGSTFVPYGRLLEMVRARYDGVSVYVKAGDYETTIGPHHPMLTRRGMVRAAERREGDQVLYDHWINPARLNHHADLEKIPRVQDAFESIVASGTNSRVATPRHDLHGDRMYCYGKVEVVNPARYLLPVRDGFSIEQFSKGNFVEANAEVQFEAPLRSSTFGFPSVELTTASSVSRADLEIVAQFEWLVIQEASLRRYQGWAFDASTLGSLYCSDGFVVSNCRCTMSLVT
jgi:hypothetical protein